MQIQALVIDDDAHVAELIEESLKSSSKKEFFVRTAATGGEGLRIVRGDLPDIVLLDWKLPDISGIDVLKLLRKDAVSRHIPVIMLTVVNSLQSKVAAFEDGEADDYVVKPFHPEELLCRVRAVLRRRTDGLLPTGFIKRGPIKLDATRRETAVEGQHIELTPKEFELLFLFLKRPGIPLTRVFLLNHVWGFDEKSATPRAVDTHVTNLRGKLGKAGDCIKTVRELGYMFDSRKLA